MRVTPPLDAAACLMFIAFAIDATPAVALRYVATIRISYAMPAV